MGHEGTPGAPLTGFGRENTKKNSSVAVGPGNGETRTSSIGQVLLRRGT